MFTSIFDIDELYSLGSIIVMDILMRGCGGSLISKRKKGGEKREG